MSDSCVTNVCQYLAPSDATDRADKSCLANSDVEPLFSKAVDQMDGHISKVKNRMFLPLIDSLFAFVRQNSLTNQMREKSFETKFTANTGLIPTALLSLGQNSSEHKFICDLLIDSIQDLTSFVVYLTASQTQTMAVLLKQISDSLLKEEVIERLSLDESQIKRQSFGDIFRICEQYMKDNISHNFCPPIVLFLDEIESFDHSLITSLILILKEHIETIPLVLIMIKSNHTITLQHLLPSSATDYLIIHYFHSMSGQTIIDELIKEIFIDSTLPFKLNPNVLEFILRIYKDFDLSIQSINNLVKYSLFLHFYENQLSFLCQTVPKLKIYLKNNDIKSSKVLQKTKHFNLSLNRKELNKSIVDKVSQFSAIHTNFVNNLKILHVLLHQINSEISLTHLYSNALSKDELNKSIDSLHRLSQNQWKNCLEKCLSDELSTDGTESLTRLLKSRQTDLNSILNDSLSEPQVVIERLNMSELKNKLSNLKTRHQWKETINPSNKPKMLSKFDVWRNETIESIEQVIDHLPNPIDSDLHDLFFFGDLDSIKQNMFSVLRNDIHTSLSEPILFRCSNTTKHSKSDFHRIFELYNENQTIINTFDFFTAFKQMSQTLEPLDKNRKRTKDETNDEIIARFMNSVSNLEYIGLIQSAKHKTDHLMRLIWF